MLIGTPVASAEDKQIEIILNQLRSRQIAVEQIETYARQQTAAGKDRELKEAQARAEQQTKITKSELSITVQSNQGKAEYQRALQQAAQIRALAQADAERIARTGIAQAIATEEQVAAYGGPQYQVTQTGAQPLLRGHPTIACGCGAQGGGRRRRGRRRIEQQLDAGPADHAALRKDGRAAHRQRPATRKVNPETERLRAEIRQGLAEKKEDKTQTPATPAAPMK